MLVNPLPSQPAHVTAASNPDMNMMSANHHSQEMYVECAVNADWPNVKKNSIIYTNRNLAQNTDDENYYGQKLTYSRRPQFALPCLIERRKNRINNA